MSDSRPTAALLVAATAIVAGTFAATHADAAPAAPSTTHRAAPAMPAWALRPCPEEDSVNCRWDAGDRGNHRGHSFIVRKVPGAAGMVCVFYVKRADARRWDYCEATR